MPAIPAAVVALAALLPTIGDAVAAVVEPTFCAIAMAFDPGRGARSAVVGEPLSATVAAGFDAVAAAVQAVVDALAVTLHAAFDPVAMVYGQHTARSQQEHGAQEGGLQQGLGGFHHRCSSSWRIGTLRGRERRAAAAVDNARRAFIGGYDADVPQDGGSRRHVAIRPTTNGDATMGDGLVALYIFMLAAIAGHVIISRVPVILHTPLMSGSNFIHGIVLIGAMVVLGHADTTLEKVIGFIAVLLGAGNAAGGYVVTERMLEMFKSSKTPGADKSGGKA